MRRKDRELVGIEAAIGILDACEMANVAMVDDAGLPYVVPVNFGYSLGVDGGLTLYFHGAKEGKKADILNGQPPVAVCIYREGGVIVGKTACEYSFAYQSVMAFGRAHVAQGEEKTAGLRAIMAKVGAEDFSFDPQVLGRTAVFGVRVERLTAKARG